MYKYSGLLKVPNPVLQELNIWLEKMCCAWILAYADFPDKIEKNYWLLKNLDKLKKKLPNQINKLKNDKILNKLSEETYLTTVLSEDILLDPFSPSYNITGKIIGDSIYLSNFYGKNKNSKSDLIRWPQIQKELIDKTETSLNLINKVFSIQNDEKFKQEKIFYQFCVNKSVNVSEQYEHFFNIGGYTSSFELDFSNDETKGEWEPDTENEKNLGHFYVYIPTNSQDLPSTLASFEEWMKDIKDTLRHELQHAVQVYLQKSKNLNEVGGLPSKKIRSPEYDYYGIPIAKKNTSVPRAEHAERDIEFYTNLSDAIEEWNRILSQIPKFTWKIALDYMLNITDYLNTKILLIRSYHENNYKINKFDLNRTSEAILSEIKDSYTKMFFDIKTKKSPPKFHKAIKELTRSVIE